MIVDYEKKVLNVSEGSVIDYKGLIKSLEKVFDGEKWIVEDDFVYQDNTQSIYGSIKRLGKSIHFGDDQPVTLNRSIFESYTENLMDQNDHLQKISENLSKHIKLGSMELSIIGHEGHEYVWFSKINIDSSGKVTHEHHSYGPGIESCGVEIDSYIPN